jgi:hypothetical protein
VILNLLGGHIAEEVKDLAGTSTGSTLPIVMVLLTCVAVVAAGLGNNAMIFPTMVEGYVAVYAVLNPFFNKMKYSNSRIIVQVYFLIFLLLLQVLCCIGQRNVQQNRVH